jgi:UrcA family protein
MNTTLKSTLTAVALAAVLGSGALVTAAQARDVGDTPSQVVSYSDLNITTQDGAKVLYGRIRTAATKVCRNMFPPYNAADAIRSYKCTRELVDTAVKDVHSPVLSALHEGRNVEVATNR